MNEGWGQEQFLSFFGEKREVEKMTFPSLPEAFQMLQNLRSASIPIRSISVQDNSAGPEKRRRDSARGAERGAAANQPLGTRDRQASSAGRLRSLLAGTKILVGFEAACSHTC
jgi:hypothetical protein